MRTHATSVAAIMVICCCSYSIAQESDNGMQRPLSSVARHSGTAATSNDVCMAAARHYEMQDIPNEEIVEMFQKAADAKDVRATMWLARLYSKGRCSLENLPDKATEMAKGVLPDVIKLAEKGDVEAQFLLASAYHEGLGVSMDFEKAVKWYTPAAVAGHLTALNNLGVMYAQGHGVKPSIRKARALMAKATESGSARAANNVTAYSDDGRDDRERLRRLRSIPLVQALGMHKDEGIAFLVKNGLITDPKVPATRDQFGDSTIYFKTDGILLKANMADRITNVEGHVKNADFRQVRSHADEPTEAGQYRGELPLGLTWEDTSETAEVKLGSPDDSGAVPADMAYGMAYRTENVFFAVMSSQDDSATLKIWRVYEKWASDYKEDAKKEPTAETKQGEVTE